MLIEPINSDQSAQVVKETHRLINGAAKAFSLAIAPVEVSFDLKGRSAGMYRLRHHRGKVERVIRYNPWVFAKYFEDNLKHTVPHEVAHFIVEQRFGLRVKPHGAEWKAMMQWFGVAADVRCTYDFEGIPTRRTQRFDYVCHCRTIELSAQRHKRITSGRQRYQCRDCGVYLTRKPNAL